MEQRSKRRMLALFALGLAMSILPSCAPAPDDRLLHVLLIPADGGTESGTRADYKPLFDAISRSSDLRFDIKVAQSYGAVVEALCSGTADIAFVGPVTYLQARERGCAELLAMAVKDGQSRYYAGLFVRRHSPIRSVADMRGHSMALGDINSTSSFLYPLTMLIRAGIDPVRDLGDLHMTASHSSALAALLAGHVDVAALSFPSYLKAVQSDVPGVRSVRAVARSEAIPYPPLVMNKALPAATKSRLRQVLGSIDTAPGIRPEMIRGYGGAQVDRYDTHFPDDGFDSVAQKMAMLPDALKGEIVRKAGTR